MKKIQSFFCLLAAFLIAGLAGGCGSAANSGPGNSANAAAANTGNSAANANAANSAAQASATGSGSLSTPTDAYRTAYEMRQKKDIQGLKRVMSQEIKDFLTEIGEAEKKSLDDMLRDMTTSPLGPFEVRNEKITGDLAVLEYKDDEGEWRTIDFVKEGGEWKITLPDADPPEPDGPRKKP